MKSIFEEMGGTYRQEGDYLIPNLSLPPDTEEYHLVKAANQMEWVQRRNSVHNRAEEVILTELVYD